MYANYVLQKIIEVMPHRTTGFIIQELLGGGREVARHPFGCRIFCRLLEHASLDAHLCALLDEVLTDASALCKHAYGNFVMRHCLEFGIPMHKHLVMNALLGDLFGNVRHQHGSRVLEGALQFCSDDDYCRTVAKMLESPADIV